LYYNRETFLQRSPPLVVLHEMRMTLYEERSIGHSSGIVVTNRQE
jgi:hypothetical protein